MSPRARRLVAALLAVATVLFIGRWLVTFLTDRWWAATVSPAAVVFLTRRALVGLGIDILATTVAFLWFAVNARIAVTVMGRVPERETGGNPGFRRLIGRVNTAAWGVGLSVVLALLAGTGTSRWTDAVMLAWEGVTVGLSDPGLGNDAGLYVALLPLWMRLQVFAAMLVLAALLAVLLAYFLAGALRLARTARLTDGARRHLAALTVLLALVLAATQILRPYELAAGLPAPVSPAVVELHRSVTFVLVGVCLAVAGLTALWGLRPIHGLASGAWLVLSGTLAGAHYLLPDDAPSMEDQDTALARRTMESVAYAVAVAPAGPYGDSATYRFWTPETVRALFPTRVTPASVGRAELDHEGRRVPAWLLPATVADSTVLLGVRDDTLGEGGGPVWWPSGAGSAGGTPVATLGPLGARPGAPARAIGREHGVRLGRIPSRLVLGWALQWWEVMAGSPDARAGWYLAPNDRLRRALPPVHWGVPRGILDGGRLVWILDGFVTAEAFPMTRPIRFRGREVRYLRAGMVGVVRAEDGHAQIFLRPDADPLSRAWARVASGWVQSADRMSEGVARALEYPAELLPIHADLLAGRPGGEAGSDGGGLVVLTELGLPQPGGRTGEWLVPLEDRAHRRVAVLLRATRHDGADRLWITRLDTVGAPPTPAALERNWHRFPAVVQLRDSLLASGGEWEPGPVRYLPMGDGPFVVYQPLYAITPAGGATVVAVGLSRGERLIVGRTLEGAWSALRGEATDPVFVGDAPGRLEEARRWMLVADSALRRGDLAAFGRAFTSLRAILEGDPPK